MPVLAIAAAMILSAPPPLEAATDCAELSAAGHAAFEAHDLETLAATLEAAQECGALALALGQRAAALAWNEALRMHERGAPRGDLRAALERTLAFAPLWQAHAALGDMAVEENDHVSATRQYQYALDTIASEAYTPVEPPVEVTSAIHRKAQASRMLANEYVPTTRTRSNEPAGLAAGMVRSFVPVAVAVPVQFEFGRAEFTAEGARAAADMLDYLTRQEVRAITLIGHTDPVGSRTFNLELSEARARAVADFLASGGFAGAIEVVGRGPDEPMQVDNPALYSTPQLHQIYRRVELIRH